MYEYAKRIFATVAVAMAMTGIGSSVFSEEADTPSRKKAGIAEQFLGRLDLNHPDLAHLRPLVKRQDYAGALAAYRDYFVEKCSRMPVDKRCRYWVFGGTQPKELLEQGVVRMAGVGAVEIGLPGRVDWFPLTPKAPYFASDLPRFYWANKLTRSYVATRDPRYLETFVGYFWDHALNHRRQYGELMGSDWQGKYERPQWTWGTVLFHADRLHVFRSGMIAVCQTQGTVSFDGEPDVPVENASLDAVKTAVDAEKLAVVLMGFADDTLNSIVEGRIGFPGAPNQQVDLSWCMLSYARLLSEFKDAPRWEAFAGEKIRWFYEGGSVMADGTDLEQNFAYNWSGVGAFARVLPYYPDPTKRPDWFQPCYEQALYRLRMLAALIKPTGPLPNMDFYTALGNTDGYRKAYERFNAVFADPLVERVVNAQWGDGSLGTPAFTSIAFPFGGYYALRGGWDKQAQYLFFKASRPGAGHCAEDHLNVQLTAFGKDILVDSGGGYETEPTTFLRNYFGLSSSRNTVVVDGLRQNGSAFKVERQGAYDDVLPARWHTSPHFDFAEGDFMHGYGRVNEKKWNSPSKVDNVRHRRQILFLKEAGLWIVVDTLRTPKTETHDYTQTWNLHPDYAADEVACDSTGRKIETREAEGPNVALHHFGIVPLQYVKYYGQEEPDIRGWADYPAGNVTPAVDIHVNWQGTGDQLLVTLIEPRRGTESFIAEIEPNGENGFAATLRDGTEIAFQTALAASQPLSAGPLAANATALLTVRTTQDNKTRGIALDCTRFQGEKSEADSFEFEIEPSSWLRPGRPRTRITPITVPTGFHWIKTRDGIKPQYQGQGPDHSLSTGGLK